MDAFFGLDVASPSWRFGDAGRPFLGNRSFAQLGQMVRLKQRDVLSATIKRYGKKQTLPDGRVTRVSLSEVGANVADCLLGTEFDRAPSLLQAAFYVDHLPSAILISDLDLGLSALNAIEALGIESSDSVSKLGGLFWGELLDVGGNWLEVLEIAHSLYDWLPWLLESPFQVQDSDSLDVVVRKLSTLAAARSNFSPAEAASWSGFLKSRYGWGVDKLTLDEIGSLAGITRERVRQIQAQLASNLDFSDRKLPNLLERILLHKVEDPADEICDSLIRDGFRIEKNWTWASLFALYSALGHKTRASDWYDANGMIGGALESRKSLDSSIRAARSTMGVIKLDSVFDLKDGQPVPEEIVLGRIKALYSSTSVFENFAVVSSKGASSVLGETSKQLGVNSPLSIDVIYKGLMQVAVYRHSQHTMPPARIIRQVLLDSEFSENVDGLISGPTKDLADGQSDRWLLDFIRSSPGQVVSKAAILRAAIPLDISINTLSIYLSYASWVRLIGNGLVSIVGVNPTAADVEFSSRVEAAIAVPNSSTEFTVSPDGQEIVLSTTFSTPFLVNGALAVGTQLGQLLSGRKREIKCCPSFATDAQPDVKQGAVYGFAKLRQHLVKDHYYSEGANLGFRVTSDTFEVVH